jgi:uncharacterized protein (TIGR02996 family)
MGSEERLLLRAIAQAPEEDTPRLAYADWLDEQGGEPAKARAEFIRLQVSLYRTPELLADPAAARLRAAELLDRYRAAWGLPTGLLQSRCVIRRGFVDELIAGGDWNAANDPAAVLKLLPHHPVRRLRLYGFRPGGPDVFEILEALDVPAFRRVRHLAVCGEQWIDELFGRLFGLEQFPELESLSLIGTGLTPRTVAVIARHPRLGGLHDLSISFAGAFWLNPRQHVWRGVRDDGAVALAESPLLGNLRELSLRATAVGPAGARALAASATLADLRRLVLTENPDIDRPGREALLARFGDRVYL